MFISSANMQLSGCSRAESLKNEQEQLNLIARNSKDSRSKTKVRLAVNGTPSHSYRMSLAIWHHTVLSAIIHTSKHTPP